MQSVNIKGAATCLHLEQEARADGEACARWACAWARETCAMEPELVPELQAKRSADGNQPEKMSRGLSTCGGMSADAGEGWDHGSSETKRKVKTWATVGRWQMDMTTGWRWCSSSDNLHVVGNWRRIMNCWVFFYFFWVAGLQVRGDNFHFENNVNFINQTEKSHLIRI